MAILLADNIYNVLSTIRSRCQILKLKSSTLTDDSLTPIQKLKKLTITPNKEVDEEQINQKITKVIDFINYYEKNHLNTLLYIGKLWNEYITSKDEYEMAFEIMINYYKDILNYLLKKPLEIFNENNEIINISKNNTIDELCQKINKLVELKDLIKYNINTSLLMDKLIISLEGVI